MPAASLRRPSARGGVGERRRARGPERLDAVRDGIHAARAGHGRGQVVGQLGVVDRRAAAPRRARAPSSCAPPP